MAAAKASSGKKSRVVRKDAKEDSRVDRPVLAARARAAALFKAWLPRLGIDLDPALERPVVRAICEGLT
eukprot:974919-Prymnesium_polylepis.1